MSDLIDVKGDAKDCPDKKTNALADQALAGKKSACDEQVKKSLHEIEHFIFSNFGTVVLKEGTDGKDKRPEEEKKRQDHDPKDSLDGKHGKPSLPKYGDHLDGKKEGKNADAKDAVFAAINWGELVKNALKRPEEVKYGDGSSVNFTYDGEGHVQTYKDRHGATWTRQGNTNNYKADAQGGSKEQQMEINVYPAGTYTVTMADGIRHEMKTSGEEVLHYPKLDVSGFEKLVEKNWDRLDRNHDGLLTTKEIDQAVTDNNFTGQDAQMVVALKKTTDRIGELNGRTWLEDALGVGLRKGEIGVLGEVQQDLAEKIARNRKVRDFVNEHFKDIDDNGDGKISFIEAHIAGKEKGKFSDEERGYLKDLVEQYPKLHPWILEGLSKGDLDRLVDLPNKGEEGQLVGDLNDTFDTSRTLLDGASQKLYSSDNPLDSIKPDAIKQGDIGDCYFLAALASQAATNPGAIREMIRANADGTYTVTFPGDKDNPVTINAPTEAEITLYAQGNQYGTWPAVLEKAYGKWKGEDIDKPTIIPQEAADGGDYINKGVEILTGKDFNTTSIAGMSADDMAFWMKFNKRAGVPVVANISKGHGTDLPTGHAYSVLDFDPATQMVTVRNPWGYRELRDDKGNPLDGVNDGVFKVKFDDFQKRFDYITNPTPTYGELINAICS